nr:arginase family protein [Leucobacter edaphi]
MFLVMPEWQGSPSSRAMRIAEGAALLREDLPAASRRDVAVPLEAGDSLGTPVARLSGLLRAQEAAREPLAEAAAAGRPAIVLGGDCASSLPALEAAQRGADDRGERLAVLWFDAHPDLQDPTTSPSGAASGMTLRHALGRGAEDLASGSPAAVERVTLIGTRAEDPEEVAEAERLGLRRISPERLGAEDEAIAAALADALADADRVYVHIDLDVLDPAEFSSVHSAEPFGLTVAQLTAAVRAAVARLPLAGAAICEFAPADEAQAAEDQPSVLRILAALTSGGGNGAPA